MAEDLAAGIDWVLSDENRSVAPDLATVLQEIESLTQLP
jgi:hypothetical protein